MANDATGNPIIIDTASATVPVIATPIRVMSIVFKPNAAADQVILKDCKGDAGPGRVIADIKANGTTAELQIEITPHDSRFMGIYCTTLSSSAKCYLYLNATCS